MLCTFLAELMECRCHCFFEVKRQKINSTMLVATQAGGLSVNVLTSDHSPSRIVQNVEQVQKSLKDMTSRCRKTSL